MGSRWDREMRKDPREMALMKALGEVIKREWNPLRLTEPGAAYDSYIPGVQGLLLGRTDKPQLASHLYQLETLSMGLGGDRERCARVADKLLSYVNPERNPQPGMMMVCPRYPLVAATDLGTARLVSAHHRKGGAGDAALQRAHDCADRVFRIPRGAAIVVTEVQGGYCRVRVVELLVATEGEEGVDSIGRAGWVQSRTLRDAFR